MSFKSRIVAGGGYSVRQFSGRPTFRLFCFVSLLWLPVAVCASLPLWNSANEEFTELRRLCWWLVSAESVFIALALLFRFKERRRTVVEHHVD
ncbi:MAG: hypothetical protein JWQ71_2596 [Pedosphaera sp.]|nr:hypothetical protein [Pedosphaera sp.]